MKRVSRYVFSLLCLFAAVISHAIPSRPEPQRLVNDFAGLFSVVQEENLERMLVAFDDSTSNQIAVVTVADLEGYQPAEYATRIGLEWQVGSAEFDNGIVLLVKPKTLDSAGQVFIAVGYGLEGAIPDAYAKRIIDNELIPHFRNNDYYGGVEAACDVLMKLASGEISEPRSMEEDDFSTVFVTVLALFILICAVIILLGKNDSGNGGNGGSGGRRVYVGPIITTGHNYGGRSYGGGSFGGGFGGGFGGFGGGSFGGGGAGGSW